MRRAQFLQLVDMTLPVFGSWRERACMPFEERRKGGWGDYSCRDAVQLDLAVQLMRHGLSQKEAGRAVLALARQLWALAEDRITDLGVAVFFYDAPSAERVFRAVCLPWGEVELAAYELARDDGFAATPSVTVFVRLSTRIARLRDRAAQHGVDAVELEVWPR